MSALVTALVHEWQQLGDRVVIDAVAGGALRVHVDTDHGHAVLDLDARASAALLEALERWAGEHAVGRHRERIAELEAQVVEQAQQLENAREALPALRLALEAIEAAL